MIEYFGDSEVTPFCSQDKLGPATVKCSSPCIEAGHTAAGWPVDFPINPAADMLDSYCSKGDGSGEGRCGVPQQDKWSFRKNYACQDPDYKNKCPDFWEDEHGVKRKVECTGCPHKIGFGSPLPTDLQGKRLHYCKALWDEYDGGSTHSPDSGSTPTPDSGGDNGDNGDDTTPSKSGLSHTAIIAIICGSIVLIIIILVIASKHTKKTAVSQKKVTGNISF